MEAYMFKKAAMVFFFISFVTFWCVAQSTNNEPRLVGTWTDLQNRTWVFNTDGTGQRASTSFKFGTIDNKAIILFGSDTTSYGYEIVLSKDDKTLALLAITGSCHFLQKKT
jgi:hypothetical protein